MKDGSHFASTEVMATVRAFRESTMSSSRYFRITLLHTILMLLSILDRRDCM